MSTQKVKNPAAMALGKLGGSSKSDRKAQAARENWKKASAALALKRAPLVAP